MNCTTCHEHLSEWLEYSESEYSSAARAEYSAAEFEPEDMATHLASCTDCQSNLDLLRVARAELRALSLIPAPTDLRARIRQSLETEVAPLPTQPAKNSGWRLPWWLTEWKQPMRWAWSSGAALALVCVAMFAHLRTPPATFQDVAAPDLVADAPMAPETSEQHRTSRPQTKISAPAKANAKAATPKSANVPPAPNNNRPFSDDDRRPSEPANEESPTRSLDRNRIAMTETARPPRSGVQPPDTPALRKNEVPGAPPNDQSVASEAAPDHQVSPPSTSEPGTLLKTVPPRVKEPSTNQPRSVAPPGAVFDSAPPEAMSRIAPQGNMREAAPGIRGPQGPAGEQGPAGAPAPAAPQDSAGRDRKQDVPAPVGGFGIAGAANAAKDSVSAEKKATPKPKPTATSTPRPKKTSAPKSPEPQKED